MTRERDLKTLATELGFDTCRITSVEDGWAAGERLREYVGAGHHGQMAWMEETLERRAHPQNMWPDARSGVVIAMNYGPERDPMASLERPSHATISVYAGGKDYHDLMKKRLKRLARSFAEQTGEDVKVFVDTAPLMEKPLAAKAGVGWQGKHTNLVSREHGSWLFLGVMLTAAKLSPDAPEIDHCGSCRACLDICPTNAFPAPYKLDARKCISYLTIEHKGALPREHRAAMGNRIYGCDDCLAVCPWNKFASVANEAAFHAREQTNSPPLGELATLDDAAFRALYAGSPIKRIGRDRFVRNVVTAMGNSGDVGFVVQLQGLLEDASPVVRGASIWALEQLSHETAVQAKQSMAGAETDSGVLAEWAYVADG